MPLSRRTSTHDSGPQLLRDVWALTAVAILLLILRIIAKLRLGKFGTDDLLMTSALVSTKPFPTLRWKDSRSGKNRRPVASKLA